MLIKIGRYSFKSRSGIESVPCCNTPSGEEVLCFMSISRLCLMPFCLMLKFSESTLYGNDFGLVLFSPDPNLCLDTKCF